MPFSLSHLDVESNMLRGKETDYLTPLIIGLGKP